MNFHDAQFHKPMLIRVMGLILLIIALGTSITTNAQDTLINTHDNLVPAGVLSGDEYAIELVVEQGMWYPGGENSFGIAMYAFREVNGPLQIPGPLVRIPQGTDVMVTIRNAVSGELHINGLHSYSGASEEILRIPSGETRNMNFSAESSGAFLYWASIDGVPINRRDGIDSQLSGAFVVDPVGYNASDRVLILGEFLKRNEQSNNVDSAQYTINGRSWPDTERLGVQVGETNRWHIINSAFAGHPMHLHGIHYRVAGTADGNGSYAIARENQREVVTEVVDPGQTMTMEWEAVNAGNWLFHCHIVAHVDPANMHSVRGPVPREYDHFLEQHMSGMTLGIIATGSDKYDTDAEPTRFLKMELGHVDSYFGDNPGITVAFNEKGGVENTPVSPGPPLYLKQEELVSIEIVNNLKEPTSIHWHGMELQSFYDGVAGFGGRGASITPEIEPGQSFEVRMKPPRAGTFLYHTHLNDAEQMSAGLYGAMIVRQDNPSIDPEHDRVFVLGLLGEENPQGLRIDGPHMGINGSVNHEQQFTLGQQYRLRITNIAANNAGLAVWLNSPAGYEQWTPIAQDGADLPESYQMPVLAQRQRVSVGETFDFLWTPKQPGFYWLEVRRGGNGEFMGQASMQVTP
jgi:FtsP/CotA-like multicopper oxidase with cupredoxin domain